MMPQDAMRKILIVDDSEPKRRLLKILLQRWFSVFEATSGAEALARVGEIVPDAILLDVHMPKMDGFEVFRCLRAQTNTAQIPVLFTTVSDRDSLDPARWPLGVKDFIDWPLTESVLVAQINERLLTPTAEAPGT